MRDDLATAIAAMGAVISPELVGASQRLYQSRHELEPYRGVEIARDEDYGPHARQRLDVFFPPPTGGPPKPVLMFVHGGGFVAGDKKFPGTPYYDNVGVWAVRQGCIGVTITYRLAPDSPYPGGAADIGKALAWVEEHIATFGGDPENVVLMGQSAGSTHVATYAARPDLHPRPNSITAIAVLSGIYDFTLAGMSATSLSYVGEGVGKAEAASPLKGLVASGIPVMFGISELDPPAFQAQAMALANAFFARDGKFPNVLFLPKHNHISQIAHLNAKDTDDVLLADRLAEFIQTHTVKTVTPR